MTELPVVLPKLDLSKHPQNFSIYFRVEYCSYCVAPYYCERFMTNITITYISIPFCDLLKKLQIQISKLKYLHTLPTLGLILVFVGSG